MNEFWKRVLETCVVILGNCLYAFGVAMFIVPGGLITGGTLRWTFSAGNR